MPSSPSQNQPKSERGLNFWFNRFASHASHVAGTPWIFALALLSIVLWAATGPLLGFSEVWQLTVNTGTTIITFLMVFLIQNTQNRDAVAMHIKLDELIRATRGAENSLLDLEELTEEELSKFRETYENLAEKARAAQQKKKAAA
jgi:low affinity Fe/Cu permease